MCEVNYWIKSYYMISASVNSEESKKLQYDVCYFQQRRFIILCRSCTVLSENMVCTIFRDSTRAQDIIALSRICHIQWIKDFEISQLSGFRLYGTLSLKTADQ